MKPLIFWSSTSQRVYVTTLCYCSLLLLFISLSPSRICEARERKRERSPLYESSESHYHHGDIDQLAHHPSGPSHVQPAAYNDHKLALSATHDVEQHTVSTTAKPKSYAFGYLVRDPVRDDHFAHKERRDGKVTVGEYSVVLPDGRTQIVKYTSDSLGGFKADVTYEGEENENYFQMHHPSPSSPTAKPVAIPQTQSQPQYQPVGSSIPSPQQQQIQSPQYYDEVNGDLYRKYTPTANPTPAYRAGTIPRVRNPSPTQSSKSKNPVYLSYPLKAQRPSISPSVIYKTESGRYVDQKGNAYSGTPSPSPVYYSQNSNPSPSPGYYSQNSSPSPSPGYYSQNSNPSPTPTYYSQNSNPNPSPSPSISPASYTKVSPTSGSYRSGAIPGNSVKYYPSPSPNSLYGNGNPVGISGPSRPVKFSSTVSRNPSKSVSTNYRNVPTKTYPSSASQQQQITSSGQLPGPTAVYRPIPRGHRAGPDSPYYSKSPSPSSSSSSSSSGGRFVNRDLSLNPTYTAESSEHVGEEYSNYNHHPNAHHDEDIAFSHSNNNFQKASSRKGSKLIPIEFFKAGPATKATILQKEKQKSGKQKLYNPSPSPSSGSQVSTIFDSVSNHNDVYDSLNHNHVSAENIHPYSTSDHIYIAQQQQHQQHQQHQQQHINIAPVKSSVATYTNNYLGVTPKPNLFESNNRRHVENSGQKSRVLSVVPQTTTYDPHDPGFGSSVSYSSSSNDNGKKQRSTASDLPLGQFSHRSRHDGIVREYLVEKKFGNSGYEDELV